MSLRPMLYASSVAPLLEAAATREASLLNRVIESFRPDQHDLARREATPLFSGEVAGKAESEEQVHVVRAMARVLGVERPEFMIADGEWGDGAWQAYIREISDSIDARARALFGFLVQQTRPVFGSSVQTTWAYYGYLLLEETRELLAALAAMEKARPEVASREFIDGFHSELLGWLKQVVDRGTDLWLFAA